MDQRDFAVRLSRLLEACITEAKALHIPISPHICSVQINYRARSRFGACKQIRTTADRRGRAAFTGPRFTIEVAAVMANCEDREIKTVLLHELLHTCRGCMNHGKRWQAYARALNERYGYHITASSRYEDFGLPAPPPKEAVHYRIVCLQCGEVYTRKRRCKLVENTGLYRCGKCGGILQLDLSSTTSCR